MPPVNPAGQVEALLREGNALLDQGRLAEAADRYRQAGEHDPQNVDAFVNLGYALIELSRSHEAVAPLTHATRLAPGSSDAHYLLGLALLLHRPSEAIVPLTVATRLKPDLIVGWRELGRALHDAGQPGRAKVALAAGLAVDPRTADLHYYLGNVELMQLELDEAAASYGRALEIDPGYAAVHSNLAQVLMNLGDIEGSEAAARRALALDPSLLVAHSNLLMALSGDASCSPQDYLAEAVRLAEQLAKQAPPVQALAPAGHEPGRPLRVGFVSGDLHNHPVGFFLESVMSQWRAAGDMTAIAFYNHPLNDTLTARLKRSFDGWHDIWNLGDEEAAGLIQSLRLDVLVDLSGHTAHHRLGLFAARLVPVQAAWLGYWASTGLPTMDFLIADPVSVPPEHEGHFVESIRRLPHTRLCFTPPSASEAPEPSALPAAVSGHVTFGSFQRMTKLNAEVLALWAEVLRAVPGSRLRLQSAQMKDAGARAQLQQRLATAGIDAERVELVEGSSRGGYFAAHAQVDLILDTFPHSGATTTCEALWMGVPTLTLAGDTLLSRQGASLMTCAGLPDWVAEDHRDFVARAVQHAADLDALSRLRAGLRARVAQSPLFDAAAFTTALQHLFRHLWEEKKT
jgi:predicted O-linked N-acetylglucosamine transferase (SPINDLY family)